MSGSASPVALVTGCRSGFGLLTAVELARRGTVVYAGLRDVQTAGPLKAAAGELPVVPVQLDVTRGDQRAAAVERILAEQGRIDVLVNNAGVAVGGFLEQITEDELRHVLEVNLVGAWALVQAVLPAMRRAGRGHIINLSSISGRMALPGLGAYAASKFALEGLSEALAHEVGPLGIRVCLVEPGPYRTDIFGRNRRVTTGTLADDPYAARAARLMELTERATAAAGDPAEVARKIADLCRQDRPALRHPLGRGSRLRLAARALLPFSVWAWLVARLTTPRPGGPPSDGAAADQDRRL
ncbi:MAG: SDR family oxidoreductase [Deltaproteobacteria bacterium]|nr:MAG: SDR family oxidoreductase [Deltaproteobacteria bacterium]